jgi:hypothetical protein
MAPLPHRDYPGAEAEEAQDACSGTRGWLVPWDEKVAELDGFWPELSSLPRKAPLDHGKVKDVGLGQA